MDITLGRSDLLEAIALEEYYFENAFRLKLHDGIMTTEEFAAQSPRVWDMSLPTFTNNARIFAAGSYIPSTIDAKAKHAKIMTIVDEYHLRELISVNVGDDSRPLDPGFVLAGGCVKRVLAGNFVDDDPGNIDFDLDIFGIRMDPDEAERRVFGWVETVKRASYQGAPKFDSIRSMRTKNAITVLFRNRAGNDIIAQFVTKLYGNISRLLHEFDIATGAALADQTQIYFTKLAAIAYQTGVVPAETVKRRPTYEARLCKYYNNQSKVAAGDAELPMLFVLPDMDISAVGTTIPALDDRRPRVRVDLKYIRFNDCRRHVRVGNLVYTGSPIQQIKQHEVVTHSNSDSMMYRSDLLMTRMNIRKLVNGIPPLVYTVGPSTALADGEPPQWVPFVDGDIRAVLADILDTLYGVAPLARDGDANKWARSMFGPYFAELDSADPDGRPAVLEKAARRVEAELVKYDHSKQCDKIRRKLEDVYGGDSVDEGDMKRAIAQIRRVLFESTDLPRWHDDQTDEPYQFGRIKKSSWYGDCYRDAVCP